MALPPFAPFPPANLRKEIVPDDWEQCLDSWVLLANRSLLLSSQEFSAKVSKDLSLSEFLVSYVRETATSPDELAKLMLSVQALRKDCFLLIHRILSEVKPIPPLFLDWAFGGDFSTVYPKSPMVKTLLQSVWHQEGLDSSSSMQKSRTSLSQMLEAISNSAMDPPSDLDAILRRTGALLKACYQYGQFLMLGTDLIDSISTAYQKCSAELQKKLIAITYLSLTSLMEPSQLKISTLLDQLYNLSSNLSSDSFLVGLCSKTPLLRKMRDRLSGPEADRAKPLLQKLGEFGSTNKPRKPKNLILRKIDKGKGKAHDEHGHGAISNVHVHKLSIITQIQDLFPELGSAFIAKLLDEYDDDLETVTAHLLDDSLPPHLKSLDRTSQLPHPPATAPNDLAPALAPNTTPPLRPIRKNIFDNDAFDRLSIPPSSLLPGHKALSETAESILASPTSRPSKAAILSALAAFDSDDDERDDTYDVEDVGGTVDSAMPGSDEVDADLGDKNEESLFVAWKISPGAFGRDAETRRGGPRKALKSETGMTDESIEGWAVMLARDPRRLRRLEAKFSTFSGTQRELAPTAYRESPGGSAAEDSDDVGRGGRGGDRGGLRGRGRGRGRGGDVAGPAGEKGTQVARQRKGGQKGSRANHNRRDQRARKMARGGFPG